MGQRPPGHSYSPVPLQLPPGLPRAVSRADADRADLSPHGPHDLRHVFHLAGGPWHPSLGVDELMGHERGLRWSNTQSSVVPGQVSQVASSRRLPSMVISMRQVLADNPADSGAQDRHQIDHLS